jgi:hypothetical protein
LAHDCSTQPVIDLEKIGMRSASPSSRTLQSEQGTPVQQPLAQGLRGSSSRTRLTSLAAGHFIMRTGRCLLW